MTKGLPKPPVLTRRTLSSESRQTIYEMHHTDGLTYAEISKSTGVRMGTVAGICRGRVIDTHRRVRPLPESIPLEDRLRERNDTFVAIDAYMRELGLESSLADLVRGK